MARGDSLSVCFPAYNEEPTVETVLEEAHALLSESGLDYEILICDDGSTDRTGEIINGLANRLPNFGVLYHPTNRGIRETVEHLYHEASKDLIFINATDRQWETRIVFELLAMANDWDIIVTSRKRKPYTPLRQLVSLLFNLVPRVVFGVETFDAGSVKLVRREIIQRFPLVSRSPFSEAERIIRATRGGYRVTQYPVEVSPRAAGKARGANVNVVLAAAADVIRVWWDLRATRSRK